MAGEIELAVVTRAPDHGLPGEIGHGTAFMRALGANGVELILRLEDNDALAADRDDNKFVLLKFPDFLTRQVCRPSRPGLGQRFEITNDWIGDAGDPAEQAQAQKQVKKTTTRCCLGRFLSHFIVRSLRISKDR